MQAERILSAKTYAVDDVVDLVVREVAITGSGF